METHRTASEILPTTTLVLQPLRLSRLTGPKSTDASEGFKLQWFNQL